jgi:hypothetical protein
MGRLTLNVLLSFAQFDSRSWTSASGRLVGGKPFSCGALYLYLSRIRIAGNKAASSRSLTSAAG